MCINFRLTPVSLLILCAFSRLGWCADDSFFNPSFLSDDPNAVANLERFNKENGQAAGTYRVDISVNNEFITSKDIEFKDAKTEKSNTSGLTACVDLPLIDLMHVNIEALGLESKFKNNKCINIASAIPDAREEFDFEKLKLNLSIPQIALKNSARGYISPEQWDQGINALLLNYNFTGSNDSGDNRSDSYFLGLQGGANLGAWRLRDYSTWNYNSSDGNKTQKWNHISTFAERSIERLKGELLVGDSYTPGDIFDSLSFRGAQVLSDDNMLPDSQRGFAPTIRGIAKSNAQVTVRQNGNIVYQSYVSPGAFEITDLFPTSSSGDLQVSIKEADNTVQSFSVPYSAVPLLQREGRIKYALTAGKYLASNNGQSDDKFIQGSLIWGLKNGYTAYGGSQFSPNYLAVALGLGKNLGDWGAVSADITQANSTLADDSQHSGQSLRFLYAKSLNSFGTNFQLLGYRYSTSGFYTLSDTTYDRMSGNNENYDSNTNNPDDISGTYSEPYNLTHNKKGKIQVNISQQLKEYGSIYISGSEQTYWNTDGADRLIQFGYNGLFGDINYNISYNYNKSVNMNKSDQAIVIGVSIPIGKWLSRNSSTIKNNNTYASFSSSSDNHGNNNQMAGISGSLLDNRNLSYNIQQNHTNNGTPNSSNLSANYQGGYGNANASYNYDKDSRQLSYGLSGGIIAHANGITLGQPLGDTNVLVKAPGADKVQVDNTTGIETDWRGYAIVPYASTYRQNRISLNTNSFSDHLDVDESVVSVVPTQGAVVRATFKTHVGVRALLTVTAGGKPLPFGTTISIENSDGEWLVDEDGRVYITGLPLTGTLLARWGSNDTAQCKIPFKLSADSIKKPMAYADLTCK